MSRESRMFAGILLVIVPTVMFGGLSLLTFLTNNSPGYSDNPLRHDLWRAGHAHAGVYLVLSLVMLRYVDEAVLPPFWKWIARIGAPIAAILIPSAFFLSVVSPTAKQPNGIITLAYVGAVFLAIAVVTLGIGLIRAALSMTRGTSYEVSSASALPINRQLRCERIRDASNNRNDSESRSWKFHGGRTNVPGLGSHGTGYDGFRFRGGAVRSVSRGIPGSPAFV